MVELALDLERPCLPRLEADAMQNWLCIDISPIELPAVRRVPASESCSLNEETASWPDVAGVISMASAFFSCGLKCNRQVLKQMQRSIGNTQAFK